MSSAKAAFNVAHTFKALSVGAKACSGGDFISIRSPQQDKRVLNAPSILRTEIERDMKLMGVTSVDQLCRENCASDEVGA